MSNLTRFTNNTTPLNEATLNPIIDRVTGLRVEGLNDPFSDTTNRQITNVANSALFAYRGVLPANQNLNTVRVSGLYGINSASVNAPRATAANANAATLLVIQISGTRATQIFMGAQNNLDMWIRQVGTGSTPWREIGANLSNSILNLSGIGGASDNSEYRLDIHRIRLANNMNLGVSNIPNWIACTDNGGIQTLPIQGRELSTGAAFMDASNTPSEGIYCKGNLRVGGATINSSTVSRTLNLPNSSGTLALVNQNTTGNAATATRLGNTGTAAGAGQVVLGNGTGINLATVNGQSLLNGGDINILSGSAANAPFTFSEYANSQCFSVPSGVATLVALNIVYENGVSFNAMIPFGCCHGHVHLTNQQGDNLEVNVWRSDGQLCIDTNVWSHSSNLCCQTPKISGVLFF